MSARTATSASVLLEEVRYAFPGGEFELRVERLAVAPGEVVALVGPSGCGKTTALELVAGIRLPHAGRVAALGFDWAAHDEAARRRQRLARVGLVFQEFELLEHLSVLENVTLSAHLDRRLARDGATEAFARELADAAGIGAFLGRRPRRLSQGERQRVAVCRALVTRPALVLADEPTGNLDARTAGAVLDLLIERAREQGATLVMVTHDASLLARFDRVVDLREVGR